MDKYPTHIYHYTDIKSLACILESEKIRLSPLTRMDDALEGYSSDLQNAQHYTFVSCWTDTERENIALWAMYGGGYQGVRLRMPANMMQEFDVDMGPDWGANQKSLISQAESDGDDYIVLPSPHNHYLVKVNYKTEEELKRLSNIDWEQRVMQLNFGVYKIDDWAFQSEWRFIVHAIPKFDGALYDAITKGIKISVPFLYATIKPEAMSQIEILLGPKTDSGDEIIVKSLLEAHNIKAKCTKSKLLIR